MKAFADMMEWSREIQRMPDGPEKEAARRAYDEEPWTVEIGPRFWGLRFFAVALVCVAGAVVVGAVIATLLAVVFA
jgi:hypothetical protein